VRVWSLSVLYRSSSSGGGGGGGGSSCFWSFSQPLDRTPNEKSVKQMFHSPPVSLILFYAYRKILLTD
jgi:hypothetical protein